MNTNLFEFHKLLNIHKIAFHIIGSEIGIIKQGGFLIRIAMAFFSLNSINENY